MDPRGGGESVVAHDAIRIESTAADVLSVMDALGVESCVLMGESMGALTALCAAALAPARIEALVLVSPILKLTAAAAGLAGGARKDWPATASWFVDACLTEPDATVLKPWARRLLLRADGSAAARMLEQAIAEPIEPDLASLHMPTLIVHGTADALVPTSVAEDLAGALPNASLDLLENVGHAPTVTRPALLAEHIERWLAQVAARS
jgi:3-oxoadipate enol-lactonase